jgi:hypothetical protein
MDTSLLLSLYLFHYRQVSQKSVLRLLPLDNRTFYVGLLFCACLWFPTAPIVTYRRDDGGVSFAVNNARA